MSRCTPGHQTREAKGELEAEVFLEVTAKIVTVEVVQNLESFSSWQDVAGDLQRLIAMSGREASFGYNMKTRSSGFCSEVPPKPERVRPIVVPDIGEIRKSCLRDKSVWS